MNDDGLADLIASTGHGVPGQIRVLDGKSLSEFEHLNAFSAFNGGDFVGGH